jgi:hypothetical protein
VEHGHKVLIQFCRPYKIFIWWPRSFKASLNPWFHELPNFPRNEHRFDKNNGVSVIQLWEWHPLVKAIKTVVKKTLLKKLMRFIQYTSEPSSNCTWNPPQSLSRENTISRKRKHILSLTLKKILFFRFLIKRGPELNPPLSCVKMETWITSGFYF